MQKTRIMLMKRGLIVSMKTSINLKLVMTIGRHVFKIGLANMSNARLAYLPMFINKLSNYEMRPEMMQRIINAC
jgi:hypothetical protein